VRSKQIPGKDQPPDATRTKGRRARRREEIRERLYQAALSLFKTKGFQATRVKDITDAADVGKGTFFNYFPTKEHVLMVFGAQQMEQRTAALKGVEEGRETASDVLRSWYQGTSDYRTPPMINSYLMAILASEATRATILPVIDESRKGSEKFFAIGQQKGEIRRDYSAAELARIHQELAYGTSLFWSVRPTRAIDDLIDANFSLFCSARVSARVARSAHVKSRPRGRKPQAAGL
jgi:AcrR family transcriptional regulator